MAMEKIIDMLEEVANSETICYHFIGMIGLSQRGHAVVLQLGLANMQLWLDLIARMEVIERSLQDDTLSRPNTASVAIRSRRYLPTGRF